jgi:hypothetical protein
VNQNRASGFFDAFSFTRTGCHFARKRYKSSLVSRTDGTSAGGRAMERKLLQARVTIAGFAGIADATQRSAAS